MKDSKFKKLVLYYSFEGSTRTLGESMAKAVEADIAELKYRKELKSRGFIKYLWGGKQIIFKEKPDILPLEVNLDDYDIVFIGTPVWAESFTPPLRTLFSQSKINNKMVALFCCHKGNMGKTFRNLKNELKDNRILGEIDFNHPVKHMDDNIKKAEAWANEILEKAATYK